MIKLFKRIENKFFKKRVALINTKVDLEIEKKHMEGSFSLYETSFFKNSANSCADDDSYKNLCTLVKAHDSEYNIPLETGQELESCIAGSDSYLGVYFVEDNKDEINHVLNEGVRFSIGNYKAETNNYGLSLTPPIIPLQDLTGYTHMLDRCNSGKIGFICKFPKNIFDRDLKLKDSYRLNELKSEFYISSSSIVKVIALNSENKYTLYDKGTILSERDSR